MEKIVEKLILALLEAGSINSANANTLLTELGSKYPSYTPDMRLVYGVLKNGAATAAALNTHTGISEVTLLRMVKSGFLVKTADKFSLA